MLFRVYDERFVISQSEIAFADSFMDWIPESELFSIFKLHKSSGETEKYNNRPVFSLTHNSFRPNIDIFLYPYEKQLEVLFEFRLPIQIEIFMMICWVFMIFCGVGITIEVFNGLADAKFLLLPLALILISGLMTYIGYRVTTIVYRKRIREKMNEIT